MATTPTSASSCCPEALRDLRRRRRLPTGALRGDHTLRAACPIDDRNFLELAQVGDILKRSYESQARRARAAVDRSTRGDRWSWAPHRVLTQPTTGVALSRLDHLGRDRSHLHAPQVRPTLRRPYQLN